MGVSTSEMQDDPDTLRLGMTVGLVFMYDAIPDPPVSPAAPLASAAALRAPADGVDRISRLPDQILRNVVSRLSAKDAACTAALASRWRSIWRSAPLAFVDAHVLPARVTAEHVVPGGEDASSKAVVAAASGALAKHPGPVRCFHLTRGHMASHQAEAARCLELLAAKGVQELVFFNRPWPHDFPLPVAIFSCVSVTRLHLGVWRLPDTAALPRYARFPHLREVVLSLILMGDRDLAFFVEKSPVLENLTIIASQTPVRLRLVSRSLRCVQLGIFALAEVSVVDAPRLERLFFWMSMLHDDKSRIKIGHAPNLRMLGHWQPGNIDLEIGSTVIKVLTSVSCCIAASTKVSPSTIVPSVRILALEVEFEVCNDVKMLPGFLRCFPNVETLHAYFRGERSELMFLKFIAERARVLKKMVVMVAVEFFSSEDDISAKLKLLTLVKWASQDCKLIVLKNLDTEDGLPAWSFRMASDSSCMDPFDLLTADAELRGADVLHHSSTV
ncbi:hypothetical protein PR202_ga17037 [Eleusine coracana subsp. coracana]|uniref:F-box domain-containing protein n=1 Tax=Eleusine coracana subsp. coracana TaxID=191504 RepID=A0AAV5CP96_ELECO|nr:hypothetical protein PR202_ga17037 [Eleusine coracana subsp. coracana]